MLPKGEDAYRVRRFRGATYFTSRQASTTSPSW